MRVMLSPADPQVLYVNTNRNILRSLDGGISWTEKYPAGQFQRFARGVFHISSIRYLSTFPHCQV